MPAGQDGPAGRRSLGDRASGDRRRRLGHPIAVRLGSCLWLTCVCCSIAPADGGRISASQALELYTDAPLHALGRAADAARRRRFADTASIATYLIDRNINYTNACVTACKFCAFYRAPQHAEAWTHPLEEILRRCGEAVELGATQIMLQGGHNPDLGIEWYEETFSAVRSAYPSLALHSLGGSEVVHISRVSGLSYAEVIARLHAAGLDSFAGGWCGDLDRAAAERDRSLEETGAVWLEVMETAHGLGVQSTATFMMGTGETNAERIEHLRLIRDVQDRTGGFRSFIPWTYQPENNHLRGRTLATPLEYLRLLAVARLFFDNIAHLQVSQLTLGKEVGQLGLHYGADDLGSVMLEENVVSSAGAKHRWNLTELIHLIRSATGFPRSATPFTTTCECTGHRPDDPEPDERIASHFASTAPGAQRVLPLVAS